VSLSNNQRAHLVRLGFAVDEMETRCEAKRRAIEATREALRRQREKVSRLSDQAADWSESQLATQAEQANAEHEVGVLEQQIAESHEELTRLIEYFDPLRQLYEAVLARSDTTSADLGVPRGDIVPRGREADIVIGGRSRAHVTAAGSAK